MAAAARRGAISRRQPLSLGRQWACRPARASQESMVRNTAPPRGGAAKEARLLQAPARQVTADDVRIGLRAAEDESHDDRRVLQHEMAECVQAPRNKSSPETKRAEASSHPAGMETGQLTVRGPGPRSSKAGDTGPPWATYHQLFSGAPKTARFKTAGASARKRHVKTLSGRTLRSSATPSNNSVRRNVPDVVAPGLFCDRQRCSMVW